MSTTVWNGSAGGGSWGTAGNWSNGVPVDESIVIIPAGVTEHITDGLSNVAVKLDLLHTQEGSIVNIGSSGTPLSITAEHVIHEGAGTVYYKSSTDGTDITNWIQCRGSNTTLSMNVEVGTDAEDDIVRLDVSRGSVNLVGSTNCNPAVVNVSYDRNRSTDAHLTISGAIGAATILELNQSGGMVTCSATGTIASLNIGGGIFTHNTGTFTIVRVSGGIYKVLYATAIADVRVFGGVCDLTQSGPGKTITELFVMPPGEIVWRENLDVITNQASYPNTNGFFAGSYYNARNSSFAGSGRT